MKVGEENNNDRWLEITGWIDEICIETGTIALLPHHEGKQRETDDQGKGGQQTIRAYKGRGASSIVQRAQLVINIEKRKLGDLVYTVAGLGKLKEVDVADLTICQNEHRWFGLQYAMNPGDDAHHSNRVKVEMAIQERPNDGEFTIEDIATDTGLTTASVKNVLYRKRSAESSEANDSAITS